MATSPETSQPKPRPIWQRVLTSGWLLSPVIVIALLAVTFFGYGYYTRHQKTTYSRGGAFGVASQQDASQNHTTRHPAGHKSSRKQSTASKKHPAKVKTTKTVTGSEKTGTASSTPKPAVSATPTTPATRNSPKPKHTKGAPVTTAVATPKVGQYTLAVHGAEEAKFGPIGACHNNFPSRATLAVHHASGESPTAYDFDMRLYPSKPNQHDERHIYDYSPSAVTLSFEEETVTCSGIKQSSTVNYTPTQTRVQLPLTVGKTWHNHGGGSSRTETGTSKVEKRSSITVQGKRYAVYEISTTLALTGSETGERDQTWWYSPALAMPLRFGETLHGNRSGAKYSEYYSATVVGLP
jgi:hypothetical protein